MGVLEGVLTGALLDGPEGVPALPENVDPRSPNLMLEKMTEAPGLFDSTSVGTPEVVAHGPRETPGEDASPSAG